jgi:hypothetical protein
MFNTKKIEALERRINELERKVAGPASLTQRVSDLEESTKGFRVGRMSNVEYQLFRMGELDDDRPRVTVREAIEKILGHLKLAFNKTDAVPERIELKKSAS